VHRAAGARIWTTLDRKVQIAFVGVCRIQGGINNFLGPLRQRFFIRSAKEKRCMRKEVTP